MRPVTLSEAWRRIASGESDDVMLAEFLDSFYLAPDRREQLIALSEEPAPTGDGRLDALAGAVCEYLARQNRLPEIPAWAFGKTRYLDRPWHTAANPTPGMIEYLTFASPAEFKSREIFTDERPLRRARRPAAG